MTAKPLIVLAFVSTALLSGCASNTTSKADPLEGVNRSFFALNESLDEVLLQPAAKGYQAVTPGFVRAGVSNAFTNVGDVSVSVNNLLQGKPKNAFTDAARFLINSTLGVLGLFDVATPMGLEKHDEDFGQTLGKWGVGSGPYLVLPLMGPSTVRDTAGRGVDSQMGWAKQVDHSQSRYSGVALEVVDLRANLLGAGKTLEEAALDKYQFLRDAYLQRRIRAIHDGKAPQAALDQLEEDLEPPRPAKSDSKK